MKKLNDQEIKDRMKEIDKAWELKGHFIQRTFQFKDFIQAFSFMTSVAFIAEKANHHPNWENVYNTVKIALHTHDANGLTEKDFQFAKQADELFKNQ